MGIKKTIELVEKAYWDLGITNCYHTDTVVVATIGDKVNLFGTYRQLVSVDRDNLIFFSIYPVNLKKPDVDLMSRKMSEMNYDMAMGSLEVDTDDGEMRFRSACYIQDGDISKEVIARHIRLGGEMLEHLHETFKAVDGRGKGRTGGSDEDDEGGTYVPAPPGGHDVMYG